MIGIYFLKKGDEIVYVGQSVNIERRIKEHRVDKKGLFDSYTTIECTKENLDSSETSYLFMYRPKLNKKYYHAKNKNVKYIQTKKDKLSKSDFVFEYVLMPFQDGTMRKTTIANISDLLRSRDLLRVNNKKIIYGYDLVAREMTSRLEYDIMTYIRDSSLPRTIILNFRVSKIVKDLKTTRNTVFKVIKKLRDLNFIKKVENTYYMNPKVYVPPMIKDDDLSRFQEEWESLND